MTCSVKGWCIRDECGMVDQLEVSKSSKLIGVTERENYKEGNDREASWKYKLFYFIAYC